jgi:hypothetical protein
VVTWAAGLDVRRKNDMRAPEGEGFWLTIQPT